MFGYENKNRFPLYVSRKVTKTTLNLLLIWEKEKQHYVWIIDFNRFMFYQKTHQHRQHFYRYCLQCITSKEILNKHTSNCIVVNGKQAVQMPEKGNWVQFKNFNKQLPAPFVIYADFEALTQKIDSCQPDTEKYQKHVDCNYANKLIYHYDDKFTNPFNCTEVKKLFINF